MKIRPLTGQVLVEMLPPESEGLIELPEQAKRKPLWGIVREIGPWPKTKNGLAELPPFSRGAKVFIQNSIGQQVGRHYGERFKLVKTTEILAVDETPKGT